MHSYTVEIERLVLADLPLGPDQAEWIRWQTEQELQRLLEAEGLPHRLRERQERSEVTTQLVVNSPSASENEIARGIALSLYRLMASVTG